MAIHKAPLSTGDTSKLLLLAPQPKPVTVAVIVRSYLSLVC